MRSLRKDAKKASSAKPILPVFFAGFASLREAIRFSKRLEIAYGGGRSFSSFVSGEMMSKYILMTWARVFSIAPELSMQ